MLYTGRKCYSTFGIGILQNDVFSSTIFYRLSMDLDYLWLPKYSSYANQLTECPKAAEIQACSVHSIYKKINKQKILVLQNF